MKAREYILIYIITLLLVWIPVLSGNVFTNEGNIITGWGILLVLLGTYIVGYLSGKEIDKS